MVQGVDWRGASGQTGLTIISRGLPCSKPNRPLSTPRARGLFRCIRTFRPLAAVDSKKHCWCQPARWDSESIRVRHCEIFWCGCWGQPRGDSGCMDRGQGLLLQPIFVVGSTRPRPIRAGTSRGPCCLVRRGNCAPRRIRAGLSHEKRLIDRRPICIVGCHQRSRLINRTRLLRQREPKIPIDRGMTRITQHDDSHANRCLLARNCNHHGRPCLSRKRGRINRRDWWSSGHARQRWRQHDDPPRYESERARRLNE